MSLPLHQFQIVVAPYWNVNDTVLNMVDTIVSIVVAPYWNVNFDFFATYLQYPFIVVAPYWNVNSVDLALI